MIIGIGNDEALIQGLNAIGIGLTMSSIALSCDNFLVMWAMVKQGLGLGIIDDRIGDADPQVARALPDLAPLIFPVWLVAHREIHNSPRLRLVFDALAAALT